MNEKLSNTNDITDYAIEVRAAQRKAAKQMESIKTEKEGTQGLIDIHATDLELGRLNEEEAEQAEAELERLSGKAGSLSRNHGRAAARLALAELEATEHFETYPDAYMARAKEMAEQAGHKINVMYDEGQNGPVDIHPASDPDEQLSSMQ